jgi:xanthine/CO dehydrogenase XdhC/CoxF family maturation factor
VNELASILALASGSTEPLALATVVNVSGSAYRRPGARMLITASGRTAGSISGGCLEGDAKERAIQIIESQHSMLVTYDSTSSEDIIFGLGLGCNGVVQVMIEPLAREDANGLLAFLSSCHHERKPGRMATVFLMRPAKEEGCDGCPSRCNDCDSNITSFKTIERTLQWPDGRVTSSILRPALRSALDNAFAELAGRRVKTGTAILPGNDEADWLIETIVPPPSLFIFGAGDDAIPVATLAQQLGWHVTVTDARPAFANRSRFPNVDVIQSQRAVTFNSAQVQDHLAIVMTHSYEQDKTWLKMLLASKVKQISQIGPKLRTMRLLDELGLDASQHPNLQTPAGLDIGAETPGEVALSLISGLQAAITRHRGGYLSERDGPIHEAVS